MKNKESLELVTSLFQLQDMFTKITFLICLLESGNWKEKKRKRQNIEYLKNKKSFLDLLRTLDMVVLEESSLGLRFSKKILAYLKMSSRLLKCSALFDFSYFVFQIFCRKFSSIFHTQVSIKDWHKFLHLFLFTLSLVQLLWQILNQWF